MLNEMVGLFQRSPLGMRSMLGTDWLRLQSKHCTMNRLQECRSISTDLAVDDVGVKVLGHDSQTPGVQAAILRRGSARDLIKALED